MSIRRVAIIAATVLGTLSMLYLAWVFRQALALFIFSLAVAAATRPMVEGIHLQGVPRTRAIILGYLLIVGLVVAIVMAIGNSLLSELQMLADMLARTYDRIWTEWPEGTQVQQTIVQQIPAPADLYKSFSPEQRNSALNGLLGFTIGSASFFGQLVAVLILSIYWSIDRVHFERLLLSILPVESRSHARNMWRNIERDFGSYIRSEVLQSLLAGILIGFGLWAMGVDYPVLLAVFGSLAWLIPWLGGVLALIPIALTAFSESIGLGVTATAFAIAILFLLEFVIEPRFLRRRRFSPLLSILLIIALIEPYGLLGFVISPPLAAAIELIFRYNVQYRAKQPEYEPNQRISQLREQLQLLRRTVARNGEPPEPQIANMLNRLEVLINRTDEAMEKEKQPSAPWHWS